MLNFFVVEVVCKVRVGKVNKLLTGVNLGINISERFSRRKVHQSGIYLLFMNIKVGWNVWKAEMKESCNNFEPSVTKSDYSIVSNFVLIMISNNFHFTDFIITKISCSIISGVAANSGRPLLQFSYDHVWTQNPSMNTLTIFFMSFSSQFFAFKKYCDTLKSNC